MGYHPETMVCSWPSYPAGAFSVGNAPRPWTFGRALYALSPWIGFDIWHIDPERRTEGQRTDDSCGWFDRRPGEYADAVKYLMSDTSFVFEVERSLKSRADVTHYGKYTYPRMSTAETLAVALLVARHIELRRWWNGQNGKSGAHASWVRKTLTKARKVDGVALDLTLNPLDNLSSVDSTEALVGLIAAAMHRRFKPWWKHPRWHVHHWRIHVNLVRNLKRMLEPCATCHRPLGFGYCPTSSGGQLHHGECLGHMSAAPEAAKGT